MQLISLIGEQPIPNLLVDRFLKPQHHTLVYSARTERVADHLRSLLSGSDLEKIEQPYSIESILDSLEKHITPDAVLNLTGGTKPMALAAYELGRKHHLRMVYLQSENAQSILFNYHSSEVGIKSLPGEKLPTLLKIDDFLKAYGLTPQYKPLKNSQESGLQRFFEKHCDECQSNLDLQGVEIDFVLRRGNHMAVVEAKDTKKGNTRQGIDQLNTISGREYLGTYTGKLLIVSRPLGPQLSAIAEARNIHVVLVQGQEDLQTGRLNFDRASKERLLKALEILLGPEERG